MCGDVRETIEGRGRKEEEEEEEEEGKEERRDKCNFVYIYSCMCISSATTKGQRSRRTGRKEVKKERKA